jgi:hypothetical protein
MSHLFKAQIKLVSVCLGLAVFYSCSIPTLANAKTFKKLVETGQKLSAASTNASGAQNQPVERISDAAIGSDGQVAVFIKNKAIVTPPPGYPGGYGNSEASLGIYSISKGGAIKVVQQGGEGGSSYTYSNSFTGPSISEGLIAFGTYVTSASRYASPAPKSILQVGTPSDVKSYPSIYALNFGADIPKVSFTNGLAYALESSYKYGGAPNYEVTKSMTLRRLNIRDVTPTFTTLSSDPNNREIRSGSRSLLLLSVSPTNVYRLFERPHDGQFSELKPIGKNPGSCGFAVSYENVVSCSAENGQFKLSARFGAAGSFVAIPLAGDSTRSVSSPSISQNKIIFFAAEQGANQAITQRIYLSLDGKTPTRVISTGDQLDGKVITELALSDNGRALSGNYAVFTATFSNSSKALYRVDF